MIWRPDTSYRVVDRLDWLGDGSELLSVGISQQDGLLQDRVWFKVADTDSLLATIDVCALDDWVLVWAWRNGDLDAWVGLCEAREGVADEEAKKDVRNKSTEICF